MAHSVRRRQGAPRPHLLDGEGKRDARRVAIEKGDLMRPGPASAADGGDEEARGRAGGPVAAFAAPLQAVISPGILPFAPGPPSGGDPGSGRGPLHILSRL